MTQKIVINRCCGGFLLSLMGVRAYARRKGDTVFFYADSRFDRHKGMRDSCQYFRIDDFTESYPIVYTVTRDMGKTTDNVSANRYINSRNIPRDDPDLVAVVEDLGLDAGGEFALLRVVAIPDDVEWVIEDHEGLESVHEKHRQWI